jgi:hypothetical protein
MPAPTSSPTPSSHTHAATAPPSDAAEAVPPPPPSHAGESPPPAAEPSAGSAAPPSLADEPAIKQPEPEYEVPIGPEISTVEDGDQWLFTMMQNPKKTNLNVKQKHDAEALVPSKKIARGAQRLVSHAAKPDPAPAEKSEPPPQTATEPAATSAAAAAAAAVPATCDLVGAVVSDAIAPQPEGGRVEAEGMRRRDRSIWDEVAEKLVEDQRRDIAVSTSRRGASEERWDADRRRTVAGESRRRRESSFRQELERGSRARSGRDGGSRDGYAKRDREEEEGRRFDAEGEAAAEDARRHRTSDGEEEDPRNHHHHHHHHNSSSRHHKEQEHHERHDGDADDDEGDRYFGHDAGGAVDIPAADADADADAYAEENEERASGPPQGAEGEAYEDEPPPAPPRQQQQQQQQHRRRREEQSGPARARAPPPARQADGAPEDWQHDVPWGEHRGYATDDAETRKEKQALLMRLCELSDMGVRLTRKYDMRDSIDDMRYEIEGRTRSRELVYKVQNMKKNIRAIPAVVCLGNSMIGNPLDLSDWIKKWNETVEEQTPALQSVARQRFKRSMGDEGSPMRDVVFAFLTTATGLLGCAPALLHRFMPELAGKLNIAPPNPPPASGGWQQQRDPFSRVPNFGGGGGGWGQPQGQQPPWQGQPQGQQLPWQGQPQGQYPPWQGQPQGQPPWQGQPQGQYPPQQQQEQYAPPPPQGGEGYAPTQYHHPPQHYAPHPPQPAPQQWVQTEGGPVRKRVIRTRTQ